MKCLVVFLGGELWDGTIAPWWSYFLNPRFRHCFLVMPLLDHWIRIELRNGVVSVKALRQLALPELVAYYQSIGATVIETSQDRQTMKNSFVLWSCVGLIKMHLGLRSFAVTPYQLYRSLGGS